MPARNGVQQRTVRAGHCSGEDALPEEARGKYGALHGFVSLEASDGFSMPVSIDRSFGRLVHALVRAMSSWSTGSEPVREVPAR